jgi:hypothetical protein
MRIGETIATYDVGLALRGKSGKFEITSPTGEVYDVTCKPNHSISYLEWSSDGMDNPPFLIKKIVERAPVADKETAATVIPVAIPVAESQVASPSLPFMLEQPAEEQRSSNAGNFELLYVEDNPEAGQSSACIYLTSDPLDQVSDGKPLLTSRCATLNELDSEIRRLQAQLDDIRSRAKKMFYKTQALEASA